MKTSERHRRKDNGLALMLGSAQNWSMRHQRALAMTVGGVLLAGVALGGYAAWQRSIDTKARTLLAGAMIVEESRVMPPGPPAGTTNDPAAIPGQAPGTYPSEKAKLEAALPKLLAAADAYPTRDAGQTARYHAASTLVGLGRFDEAVKQYDLVAASGSGLVARMSRLGKAEAQLRAGQHDAAIVTLKALAEEKTGTLPVDAVLMELARAYRGAGKADEAKKTLTQIVEQHADSPFAAEAKTELDRLKS